MPTEIVLRKRASTRAGEIGLFCDVEVWEEEFSAIKNDSDVKAVVSQPRSLKRHKFAWALATKVAEACDFLNDKDDAMEYMLIEAKHAKWIYDHRRDISYARAKPTNWGAMDGTAFTKLLKRMTHVVGTHIVPGIDNDLLRAEIEKMLNPDLLPSLGPEPPPITEIPDGPGTGHNSRAAAEPTQEERNEEWAKAAADRAAARAEAEASNRAAADRAAEQDAPPPPEADNGAPSPDPSPEPPEARETASGAGVKVTDPGDPDWNTQLPGDVGSYNAYARFHIQRVGGGWQAREWLNAEEQWQMRSRLTVPIGHRKVLERYCDELGDKK